MTIGWPASAARTDADPEPVEDRRDDLVERQALLGAQLGRHADLGVDDAVGGQVLGALGRDAGDRVGPLHDPEGVGEGLEVELEALAVGAAPEPGRQLVDVGRRQRVVAVFGGEVDDRRRAQPAIEMVVEERLGSLDDGREIRHGPMVRGQPGLEACARRGERGAVTRLRRSAADDVARREGPVDRGGRSELVAETGSAARAAAVGSSLAPIACLTMSSGISSRPRPAASAWATSEPTMWWAARNGMPRRTRVSATAVAVV